MFARKLSRNCCQARCASLQSKLISSSRAPMTRYSRSHSSGGSNSDIDTMSAEELRKLVKDLRLTSAIKTPTSDMPTRAALSSTKGDATDNKDITIVDLQRLRDRGQPITMVTAYDFPSAVHVDKAGVDVILVGDSVGMVVLGYDTTLPVTFEDILHHCKAVSRGAQRPLLVGDLPFGSYEVSADQAQRNAYRLLKEGGMEAVKVEGADAGRLKTVETLVRGGIAVMGHIGLTPQSYSTLGGFRAQGRHARQALELVEQARRLEGAGVFAMVVECVPAEVAQALTQAVSVPTIGIGAGPHTSGQVLVYHDLLGILHHPHHAKVTPKFCKQYSSVGVSISSALQDFVREVREGGFPGKQFSPYSMVAGEMDLFRQQLAQAAAARAAPPEGGAAPPGPRDAADSDPIKLY